ncbi:DNA adenine methylase [Vogesella oryzagri]
MRKRNWKSARPASLSEAMELCIEFAAERRRPIKVLADLMGVETKTLYRWLAETSMPLNRIRQFESFCGIDLVSEYRVVQHHLEEFVRQFKWALSSREVFKWQQMTRPETLTDIQRAARFFYLQHHAFGGKVDGQNYGTATTAPMVNLCRIEENLSAAHLRLTGTNIERLSWQDCLKRYDRPYTFFYADPPYWQTEGYGVPFDFEQYEQLAKAMRECKGKVMVSINDHPDIRAAFAGFWMEGLDIKYSTGNSQGAPQTSRELVIANWEPAVLGGLF